MSGFGETLHGGPVDASNIERVRGVLLFEEPELKKKLVRFAALLVLSSAIATYGLISDSVATVIGAMIVAPLMLPIMGLAFGISIADRKAIVSSLVVGICGIVTAIAVGYFLSLPFVHTLDPAANSQIISRTSPRLVDLFAALATGLAGAFAISRSDVSDTLPGVAIAISLVPPLANVGILLGVGDFSLAMGSLLLFVTNYLAILLAGSLVFGVMGFSRVAFAAQSPRARRVAIPIVVALALAIAVPLGIDSYHAGVATLAEQRSADATRAWLAGSTYRFVSATADSDVQVVVAGHGALPPVASLQASLKGKLFGLPLTVASVPEQQVTVPTK